MIEQQIDLLIAEEIKNMEKLIYSSHTNKVFNDIQDKDIVLFIGNTRCGKSTIVNYIIGNPLQANRKKGRSFNITKQDPNSVGPAIGEGATSETTIPSSWTSTKISEVVVDAPGFDDNRGVAQDVGNSFYTKEIIHNARSVKFALITDINDIITDNIGQFNTFIGKIHKMLPNHGLMNEGMVLVFTKDRDNYTVEDIKDFLKEKIIDQPSLKFRNRQLIEYLYKSPNQIVIIKKPNVAGLIEGSEVFGTLMKTLNEHAQSIPKSHLAGVKPGISDESRAFLHEISRNFSQMNNLEQIWKTTLDELIKSLQEFYNPPDQVEQITPLKHKLIQIEDKIKALHKDNITSDDIKTADKLIKLSSIVPSVDALKENSDLYLKLKFMKFVDEILLIKNSTILKSQISSLTLQMWEKTNKLLIMLQEKALVTKEEAEAKVKKINDNYLSKITALNATIIQLQQEKELKLENERIIAQQKQNHGFSSRVGRFFDNLFS